MFLRAGIIGALILRRFSERGRFDILSITDGVEKPLT
jgi:hypothetical protein